jgi:hypothetical protein
MEKGFVLVLALLALLACAPTATKAQPAYDPNLAMTALSYSGAAYCYPSAIEAWSCLFCQNISSFSLAQTSADSNDVTFGYIGYDSNLQASTSGLFVLGGFCENRIVV